MVATSRYLEWWLEAAEKILGAKFDANASGLKFRMAVLNDVFHTTITKFNNLQHKQSDGSRLWVTSDA